MQLKRKDFLKKVCLSGFCMCGFTTMGFPKLQDDLSNNNTPDQSSILLNEWIFSLLESADSEPKEIIKRVIKKTSNAHFHDLKMNELLAEYKGDLNKFLTFLQDNWGWIIEFKKEDNIIIVDENKDYCVCPIVKQSKEKDLSSICYCSEGFAERMFSEVTGTKAKAEVISSIRRGDRSCKYRIELCNSN
jgi:predicted hydrocarbon binding protein